MSKYSNVADAAIREGDYDSPSAKKNRPAAAPPAARKAAEKEARKGAARAPRKAASKGKRRAR